MECVCVYKVILPAVLFEPFKRFGVHTSIIRMPFAAAVK